MNTPDDQQPRLTPGLREFLTEPAHDEDSPASSAADNLASREFEVEEQLLGQSASRFVREGGVRLSRVTHYLISPDDLPAIAGRRPDLEKLRLVLAKFWLMFDELPPRRRYVTVRIRIKLEPPAPALLLSPDLAGGTGAASQVPVLDVSPAVAELLRTGTQADVAAVDLGADGFGWTFQARADAPLIPSRQTTVAMLELPAAATELTGLLDAEAQISRSVLGEVILKKATPVNSAAPFTVPLGTAAEHGQVTAQRPRQGSPRPADYDLGLIIPLPEEFDCAREILSFDEGIEEDGYYIYPFSVPGSALRGAAVVLHDMGPASSGVATARLLDRHPMPVLALMGIAGALNDGLRLGDVVVASSVDEYFHRAMARPDAGGDGFEFDSGANVWRAGRDIVNFANNFRYLASPRGEFAAWRSRGKLRREAGGLPGAGTLARDEPDYLVSAIASGEIVGASVGFSRWLRRHHRQCDAIEMEAGGVAQAIYQHGRTDLIVVRGISDFADERKAELDSAPGPGACYGAWRRYAGLNAADLLATMLCSPAFPWPGTPWP